MNTIEKLPQHLRQYRHNDGSDGFVAAYDRAGVEALLEETAAKYEARFKEFEEALRPFVREAKDYVSGGNRELVAMVKRGEKALSTPSPDKALQRALLEARIDEQCKHVKPQYFQHTRVEQLRAELAALNLEGEC